MIAVKELTKQYGKQLALDNVDLIISDNKITGLIGPNGAGKSTLMKIICGYLTPTSGNVAINEKNVDINNIELKKSIGYLPENNPLYFDMYIIEYLEYIAGIYNIKNKKDRINEIIILTGLTKEKSKKIGQLSKGYKQRVGIAQAIIHDPEILILDEPTTGLDPNQIIEIRNLISGLGKNKTVLLSTHILQEVEAICDSVIIVNEGKILASEKTNEIKKKNKHTLIVEFNKNPSKEEILAIEGVLETRFVKDNIWLITSHDNIDIRETLFNFAVNNGIIILSSQIKEQKLEDIFIELVKNTK